MSAHQKQLSCVTSTADVCLATTTQHSFHHKWGNVLLIKAVFLGQQYCSTTGFTFSKEGIYDFGLKNAAVNKEFMTRGDYVTRNDPRCGLASQLSTFSCRCGKTWRQLCMQTYICLFDKVRRKVES